jgi:RNase H-fold protein (predicted Holliday junction resolvase)
MTAASLSITFFLFDPRAEASMVYAEKIKELFDLPVEFQDERLTTVQAFLKFVTRSIKIIL